MRLIDLTLPTAAENLALDEALLEEAEELDQAGESLRLWQPLEPLVVIGRSSHIQEEVNLGLCGERGIPVFRRSSGGAAIIAGPGCLMYAVVLSYDRRPSLRSIDETHKFVLGTIAAGLQSLAPGVSRQGTSDLALEGRKFSGNSVRCKRSHLLYHGTLLYDFPLPLIGQCLRTPPRQPEYRAGRPHDQFVRNLPCTQADLRRALCECWHAESPDDNWPRERAQRLVRDKFGRDEWNHKT